MDIRNYDEVLETLIALLKQFDKDLNQYQTDVYLYFDEETETATLSEFTNIGGNSWINDDHYTIYTDGEHHNSFLEYFESVSDIASVLDKAEEELRQETAEHFGYEIDEVEDGDIRHFVKENSEYHERLFDYYASEIETDSNGYYVEQAEAILDDFCEHIEGNHEDF